MTNLKISMKVNRIDKLTRGKEMRDRALELARDGMPDVQIAAVLTREGHRSPTCEKVLPLTVQSIRLAAGIKVPAPRSRWAHEASSLTACELAARLNIPVNWLYVQIRKQRLLVDRQPSGAYLFVDSSPVFDGIQSLREHIIDRLDLKICQPRQEGHQYA